MACVSNAINFTTQPSARSPLVRFHSARYAGRVVSVTLCICVVFQPTALPPLRSTKTHMEPCGKGTTPPCRWSSSPLTPPPVVRPWRKCAASPTTENIIASASEYSRDSEQFLTNQDHHQRLNDHGMPPPYGMPPTPAPTHVGSLMHGRDGRSKINRTQEGHPTYLPTPIRSSSFPLRSPRRRRKMWRQSNEGLLL